jgi:predicted RNase H-like HicB family nuclease
MAEEKDTVHVIVEYFADDDEYGPYYVAVCDELMFTTDGQTFEELLGLIRECLAFALENVDTVAEYGVVPDPRVKTVMELPEYA